MTEFVKTKTSYAAVRQIVSATRAESGGTKLKLTDGSVHESEENYYDFWSTLGTIVPETAGTIGIVISIDDDEDNVEEDGLYPAITSRYPVVAWRIVENDVLPILPLGNSPTHLLYSDGTVEGFDDRRLYESVEEAVAVLRRLAKPKNK